MLLARPKPSILSENIYDHRTTVEFRFRTLVVLSGLLKASICDEPHVGSIFSDKNTDSCDEKRQVDVFGANWLCTDDKTNGLWDVNSLVSVPWPDIHSPEWYPTN
jgi:hypothetical protein